MNLTRPTLGQLSSMQNRLDKILVQPEALSRNIAPRADVPNGAILGFGSEVEYSGFLGSRYFSYPILTPQYVSEHPPFLFHYLPFIIGGLPENRLPETNICPWVLPGFSDSRNEKYR